MFEQVKTNAINDSLIGRWGGRRAEMVVPLTSCVADGQTKCTAMSERKTGNNKDLKSPKGEKSHKCNNCNFATSLAGNLRTHMRRHNSEKLFKCDQCS